MPNNVFNVTRTDDSRLFRPTKPDTSEEDSADGDEEPLPPRKVMTTEDRATARDRLRNVVLPEAFFSFTSEAEVSVMTALDPHTDFATAPMPNNRRDALRGPEAS